MVPSFLPLPLCPETTEVSSLQSYDDSKSPNNVSMGMGEHRGGEGKEEKERSIVKGCQSVVGPA